MQLKVAKRVNLKSFHRRKKWQPCVVMDVKLTVVIISPYICCMPETNIMFICQLYSNKKNKRHALDVSAIEKTQLKGFKMTGFREQDWSRGKKAAIFH